LCPDASSTLTAPVNWEKGTFLGSGSFGKVYKCYDRDTGRYFAVKEVHVACPLNETTKVLFVLS